MKSTFFGNYIYRNDDSRKYIIKTNILFETDKFLNDKSGNYVMGTNKSMNYIIETDISRNNKAVNDKRGTYISRQSGDHEFKFDFRE